MRKSSVKITFCKSGEIVTATLISGVTIREAQLAQKAWKEALTQFLKDMPREMWPEHTGWDWERKHQKFGRLSAYKFYGIECGGNMQGLLLLCTLFRTSRIDNRKQVIYGVYLATAPWNSKSIVKQPEYALVGSVLVAVAIQVSRDEGCGGRFALHSLKQAEKFYSECGMTDLGIDTDQTDGLRYFEMTEEAAAEFLPVDSKKQAKGKRKQ
jgi:hypothetical protein